MSRPMIEVEGLSKRYRLGVFGYGSLQQDVASLWARLRGRPDPNAPLDAPERQRGREFWALRDVSFSVEEGEVLGVIGGNGAGKSTLLKILSRITAPTRGRVRLHGRVASMLEVGTGFHPELTGRENIFLNGAILGMSRAEIAAKFDEIVDFSGVEQFIDTPVKRYSSGMYVRLAFAVAAHLEPEILLVDEVLAVGDAEFQRRCLGKMGDVAKQGRTVLFVSHNMAAVRNLCHRVILLKAGHLKKSGDSGSVLEEYLLENTPERSDLSAENKTLGWHLSGFDFADDSGRPINLLYSGEDVSLRLHLRVPRSANGIIVSLGVNTWVDNIRLFLLNSDISGIDLSLPEGESTIVCRLKKLPLMPGRYRLMIKVYSKGQTVFNLPVAGDFCVTETDYFGTGRLPNPEWGGHLLVESNWEIAKTEKTDR